MAGTILQNFNSLHVTDISNVNWADLSTNFPTTDPSEINMGWIKNSQSMGITDPNIYMSENAAKKNMQGYQEYYNALMTGNSQATTIQNNKQPLGNREFIKDTGIKCTSNEGNIEDRYYVVDGMAYYNGDSVNNGLVKSAYQTLRDTKDLSNNAARIITDGNYNDNSCVYVNLIKDGYGNKESGYISTNEYNIWKKKNPAIFSENFEMFSDRPNNIVYGFNRLNNFVNYHCTPRNKNIDINIDIIMENNGKKKEYENEYENEYEENNDLKTGLIIQDDLITGFFMGSITILGLYVVFRLLCNKKMIIGM